MHFVCPHFFVLIQFLPLQITKNGETEETSSAISYGNNDVFIQDFGGKIQVSDDLKSVTLLGNTWKAFELKTPYPVTVNTALKFDFTVFDETEGHAICVEDDLAEDPFVGKNVRCLMVAGTQYTEWKHVMKENIAYERTAVQNPDPANNSLGQASRAVDGNMNTFSNTGLPEETNGQLTPQMTEFYVELDPGFVVTEVKISNRMDSFTDRLKKYTLFVKKSDTTEMVVFTQDFEEKEPPEDGIIHFKNFIIDQDKLSANDRLRVGISINNQGSEEGFPHMIGEFIVRGKPLLGETKTFDFHVANLFPESNSQIQYIAFIQDNDDSPFFGQSTFSNIELYEGTNSIGVVDPLVSQRIKIEIHFFVFEFSHHLSLYDRETM